MVDSTAMAKHNYSWSGIELSLEETDLRVVRDAYLYGVDNLVGEIGGCLGMFLGVSLITLCRSVSWAVRKTATRLPTNERSCCYV